MLKLNNKTYDIAKWISLVVLPACATLYFALAGIWGFPYGEQVVGTIAAIDTFLGVILGISTHSYKKLGADTDGTLIVDTTDPKVGFTQIDFANELKDVAGKDTVTFKVEKGKLVE